MAKIIAGHFSPDKIILFGSHAKGKAGLDSDVDLLVVMPVTESKRKKQIEIRLALHGIKISKDIIVTTPEDYEWRKDIPGTVERSAEIDGKLLYARP
ncbi:MAG: nucleotidyltransferase domain-containing protein [Nitrospinae bacterium]|nr:nucleotidyltransferase domain-containing protein [Nitrospinota bacterium]